MQTLYLRFYEELNDFLLPGQRKKRFCYTIDRKAAVKDVIEALGVPHTEVELILVNGQSVDFSYAVKDNDQISVYPIFESIDISPLLKVREKPLRQCCFVSDSHLGRLARYLRLLGFDCLYRNDFDDAEIADIASRQHRIVLTRDRMLLRRKIIDHGYFVRSDQPRQQVKEVLRRFDMYRLIAPYTRCTRCNGLLSVVAKEDVADRLEPLTRKHFDDFKICRNCGQIYWHGSHRNNTDRLLAEFKRTGLRKGKVPLSE